MAGNGMTRGGEYAVPLVVRQQAQDVVSNANRIDRGPRVALELSPYDLSKGRITFRHLEPRTGGAPRQNTPYRAR